MTQRNIHDRFPIGASIDLQRLSDDPFPIYEKLREVEPVSYIPDLDLYLVTRYSDVREVMQDDANFVVGTDRSLVFDTFGEHMMTVEDPLHSRYKNAHRKFFLPPTIKTTLEPRIRDHARNLIARFRQHGEVELRREFASRLPILTMLTLFGVSLDEEKVMRKWYDAFESALSNFERDAAVRASGQTAAEEFHELIQDYIDQARTGSNPLPSESLLDVLINTADNHGLSDDEIRRNALIIFFGGISTVEALILNTLYALSTYRMQLARVVADHSLISKAINETTRWNGPVQSATRHVVSDTELFGHTFRKGETVNCMLAAANRDPAMFDRPDAFDIDRKNAQRHVGFAVGPHHCLGSHLARTEARIALQELFEAMPDLCFDLERTTPPKGYEFRQPDFAIAQWKLADLP